jgi:hypothetical protein
MNMQKEYRKELKQLYRAQLEFVREVRRIHRECDQRADAIGRERTKRLASVDRGSAKIVKRIKILEGRLS